LAGVLALVGVQYLPEEGVALEGGLPSAALSFFSPHRVFAHNKVHGTAGCRGSS
jgi:hypothetical protein